MTLAEQPSGDPRPTRTDAGTVFRYGYIPPAELTIDPASVPQRARPWRRPDHLRGAAVEAVELNIDHGETLRAASRAPTSSSRATTSTVDR